jgi:hypothetical protein
VNLLAFVVRNGTDFADKEAADMAARNLAKANKIKMAEDRHKQNIEALTNLQKALVSDFLLLTRQLTELTYRMLWQQKERRETLSWTSDSSLPTSAERKRSRL